MKTRTEILVEIGKTATWANIWYNNMMVSTYGSIDKGVGSKLNHEISEGRIKGLSFCSTHYHKLTIERKIKQLESEASNQQNDAELQACRWTLS